jgi:PhnB protein
MADSFPQVTPYLLYEDVPAALDFLSKAFGFREQLRYTAEDGTVNHAEMRLDRGGVIFMGDPGPDFESPTRRGSPGAQVHVYLDDVDAHFQRAKAAGARIRQEPADQPYGDRRYDAWDPEGNLWSFAQHLRDVTAEEWGATASG